MKQGKHEVKASLVNLDPVLKGKKTPEDVAEWVELLNSMYGDDLDSTSCAEKKKNYIEKE